MRLSLRRMHHDYKNPSRRLLLADYGGRLPHFCQKMYTLPETWQPHPSKTRTTSFYTILVALRKMGNGHSRPLFRRKRPSKIPYSSCPLLHQVDRGQTISHHYRLTGPTICLERYYMPLWHPTYDYHRQWSIIHRQRTR